MSELISIVLKHESEDRYYKIGFNDRSDMQVWLNNEDGEGMGMKAQLLFDMVDQFFKENH